MTPFAVLFSVAGAVALMLVPRRWALVPLLVAACYVTLDQAISIGPFSFTVLRLLVASGFLRVILRRERMPGGIIGLDCAVLVWAAWACFSSVFHASPTADLVYKLGYTYNVCGFYFLVRCFCTSAEDVIRLSRVLVVMLIPVAAAMINEQLTGRNVYAALGGVPELSMVRDGRIRSAGPFLHPIMAGTVAGGVIPLMVGLRRSLGAMWWLGCIVCGAMIYASASTGPLLTVATGIGALGLWRWRERTAYLCWATVILYVCVNFVMKAPAYYLIARVHLVGGSTGWYRVRLIESSIEHLSEWWFAGTDYTRHWMLTGVPWSTQHVDITSQYVKMGVIGGLPLLFLYIAILAIAFHYVGKGIRSSAARTDSFLLWTLGSALFAHAITFFSVHYFDQSSLFFYLVLASIGSVAYSPEAVEAPVRLSLYEGWGVRQQ